MRWHLWVTVVACVLGVGTLIAASLMPFEAPMIVVLIPIVIAAYGGGLRAGMVATAATMITALFLGHTPKFTVATDHPVFALAILGVSASALCESLRHSRLSALLSRARVADTEQRFRELAEAIEEVFWLTDATMTHFHYVSPAFEQVWGRRSASLYADPDVWIDAVEPEDRPRVIAMRGDPGARGEIEFRIRRPDGAARWISSRSFPVRDGSGTVVRIAGVAMDVTEHKRLEEQLVQTQKLESLGLLAGGIAHDFNNLLAVVATNASMLSTPMPEGSDDRELLEQIETTVRHGAALTRQLLAFSRKEVIKPIVLDLNAVVSDTRKMLRRMIGEDIVLETSLDPEIRRVVIDPGHIVQVLMNLAVNARDAMPRGGKLEIQTRTVDAGVALIIRDDGEGMSPQVSSRVFEPFFTTKGLGKGTGMGLAVVHGIVEQASGRIEVESAPGAGTTFCITLPAVDAPAETAPELADVIARGHETVLVVDDDPHVRHAVSRALRASGYTVHEARDGERALGILAETPIDMLVTDVVMPGMDGRTLAQTAHAARPSLKVMYMSGYTSDEILRAGVLHGEVDLIEKPFGTQALASKVRALLDR